MKVDTQQKRVERLIKELSETYPAVAVTLYKMRFRPTTDIPTAACDYKGNGIYNPQFFEKLSDINIKAILIHECLHLYFNHFKRFCKVEGFDSYEEVIENSRRLGNKLEAWNIAADSFINEDLIKKLPMNSLPENCITFSDIVKMTGLNRKVVEKSYTEEIYKKLVENNEKMQDQIQKMIQDMLNNSDSQQGEGDQGDQSDQGQGSQGGVQVSIGQISQESQDSQNDQGQDNNGNQNSNNSNNSNNSGNSNGSGDSNLPDLSSSGIVVILDEKTYDAIKKAYGMDENKESAEGNSSEDSSTSADQQKDINSIRAGKGHGKSEIKILDEVTSITNLEWKEILSEFVYNISGKATSGRTWQRPSRRYRNVYPISQGRKRKSKTKDFTFAIDVSGSMDEYKIRRAIDVVADYAKENDMGCKYYFWSTKISEIYNYVDDHDFTKNLKNNYGGGTDLNCALNNYNSDGIGEGLIVITDLEFDKMSSSDLTKFDGPIAFIDIEPNSSYCKKSYVDAIEDSGNKYAKFF